MGAFWIFKTDSKVGRDGIITTVAGMAYGPAGYSGDGGAATNAELFSPSGVAVDSAGNLFIADLNNQRIRKVWMNSSIPSLTLTNISDPSSGNYQVIVYGNGGSVTSSVATLMDVPLIINQQPQNQLVGFSDNASFSVSATGRMPMSYQWYFSNPNLQSPAGGVAQIYSSFVNGVLITNGGSGYTTIPQVQFSGGGGGGAAGTAVVSNGMVTAINLTNAGSGYTAPPAIQIEPPNGLLIGQTKTNLNLSSITANNVGNYFVVIANVFGNVASTEATLTVFLPPQSFLAHNNTNHQIVLQLTGTPNYPYILQCASNLTPSVNWKSIFTNLADTNGNWQFTDTNTRGNQKFYRAVGQ
jgi:hypothetical protein